MNTHTGFENNHANHVFPYEQFIRQSDLCLYRKVYFGFPLEAVPCCNHTVCQIRRKCVKAFTPSYFYLDPGIEAHLLTRESQLATSAVQYYITAVGHITPPGTVTCLLKKAEGRVVRTARHILACHASGSFPLQWRFSWFLQSFRIRVRKPSRFSQLFQTQALFAVTVPYHVTCLTKGPQKQQRPLLLLRCSSRGRQTN